MDRLTINLPFTDGNPCYHYVDKEAAYNGSQKLGQYEDIGNPEELAALKAENEALRKQLENSVQLPKDRWVWKMKYNKSNNNRKTTFYREETICYQ